MKAIFENGGLNLDLLPLQNADNQIRFLNRIIEEICSANDEDDLRSRMYVLFAMKIRFQYLKFDYGFDYNKNEMHVYQIGKDEPLIIVPF